MDIAPIESQPVSRKPTVSSRLLRRDVDLRGGMAATRTAIAGAVSRGYGQAVDRMLSTPERVTSAAEGRALLASDEHPEAFADQVQKVAIAVVPAIRTVRRGRRFARVPSVLVASTALSASMTIRRGLRELQVLAALVEYRIEQATGAPADAALVKAVTVALYLDPKHVPQPTPGGLRLARLGPRWALQGALGRETGRAVGWALDAAERLDGAAQASAWAAAGASG
jgi:hypothetical protein